MKSSRLKPLLMGLVVVLVLVAVNQWTRVIDPWHGWDPGCPTLASEPWYALEVPITRWRSDDKSAPPPADAIFEADWQPLGTQLGVMVRKRGPRNMLLKRWIDPVTMVDCAQVEVAGRLQSWNMSDKLWMLVQGRDARTYKTYTLCQVDTKNGEVLQSVTPPIPAAVHTRPGEYTLIGFLPGTTQDEFLVGGYWFPANGMQMPHPDEEHFIQVFDAATGALLREVSFGAGIAQHAELEKMFRASSWPSQPGGDVARAMSATGIRWPEDGGKLAWTPPIELTSRQPSWHALENRPELQRAGNHWIQTDEICADGLALGLEMQGPRPLNALEQMQRSIRQFFGGSNPNPVLCAPRIAPMVPVGGSTGRLLMGWHTPQSWESREMIGDLGATTAASLRWGGSSSYLPLRLLALDPETALLIQEVRGTGGPAAELATDGVLRLGLVTTGDPRVKWIGTVDCPSGWWDNDMDSYGPGEMIEVYASEGGLLLALHGARVPESETAEESFWWIRVTPPDDWQWGHLEGWLGPWAPPIPASNKQSDSIARAPADV